MTAVLIAILIVITVEFALGIAWKRLIDVVGRG